MRRPPVDSDPGSARFPKDVRLRRRGQFLAVQARGRRLSTPHFGLTVAPRPDGPPRLGLVVSRRQGTAVQRNRVKRLLREWFRRHRALLPPVDIVIVARKGAAQLTYEQVRAELTRALLPRGGGHQQP